MSSKQGRLNDWFSLRESQGVGYGYNSSHDSSGIIKRGNRAISDHSFDRIPSNRNFTSLRTLVDGFQSSNCFNSSAVSSDNSLRTNSSSSTPRIAKGSIYGFAGDEVRSA